MSEKQVFLCIFENYFIAMINRRFVFHFLLFWIIIPGNLFSQEQLTQTIRGVVVDKLSKSPLPGATIVLLGGET
ncbi:MAG: hypothetical protein KAT40_04275, partial [Bacteroidales bacterium]|nr:hypothetical protein [Bacteroidales bacterium]